MVIFMELERAICDATLYLEGWVGGGNICSEIFVLTFSNVNVFQDLRSCRFLSCTVVKPPVYVLHRNFLNY